eukprot:SAG25_NODE_4758_length_754_cov_4.319084_2_plen_75_part_00
MLQDQGLTVDLPYSTAVAAVVSLPFRVDATDYNYSCTVRTQLHVATDGDLYNMFMTITDLINYYLSVPRSTALG